MKSVRSMLLMLALVTSARASLMFDVIAYDNTPFSTVLDTGIPLNAGDLVTITTDPLDDWVLGDTVDRIGNAAGLPAWPPLVHGNLSTLYGTLVAQIGSGDYIEIGLSRTFNAPSDGILNLMCWDDYYADNTGAITAEVATQPAPLPVPGAFILSAIGIGTATLRRHRYRKT